MLAKSIKVYRCKRLPFIEVKDEVLDIEFTSKLIIVEGTNGSGKSSLFNMLTPLPSDKKDFSEGGYLVREFEYKGDNYIITDSYTGRSPNYSFVKNGDELNVAGIITTQKDLCFTHFGITPSIHDILISKENFTDFTINGRKKLFSTLTKLNIDHVLKAYSKLNDKQNLNKMMLKTETQQYKLEEAKLVGEEELKKIEDDLEAINKSIDELLDMRANINRYVAKDSTEECLSELSEDIKKRDNIIRDNYVVLTAYPKEVLESELQKCHDEISRVNGIMSDNYSRLEEQGELLKTLEANTSSDLDVLVKNKNELVELIDRKLKAIKYIKDFNNPNIDRDYYRIYNILHDILPEMGTNLNDEGETIFYNSKLKEVTEKYEKLSTTINNLQVHIEHQKELSVKMKDLSGNITCPKCNHVWMFDDNVDNNDVETNMKLLHSYRQEMNELHDYILACNKYFDNYRKIVTVGSETRETFPSFWEDVHEDHLLYKQPKNVFSLLENLTVEHSYFQDINSYEKELVSISEQIDLHNQYKGSSLQEVNKLITTLNDRHIALSKKLDELGRRNSFLRGVQSTHSVLDKLNTVINFNKSRVREFNLTTMVSDIQRVLDDGIRDLRLDAINLSNMVHSQNNVTYTLKRYQEKIDTIEKEMYVIGIMLKELSPKTGIIAKTISSFLNNIIENINTTLAVMWSYKMELVPIDVETCELDYKFAVKVVDKIVIDDIKMVSRGMKEIINLSFKILMYKLLGLESYSLFLDELASNMDKHHTDNISKLVHSFVMESDFSQVFIISHKENLNYLKDAQVITLD